MREKVIARLEALRAECGTLESEWIAFDVDGDLNLLSDEQLIQVLEVFGQFEG